MLSNELMGLFGLSIFWVTVLLCAGDVWLELKDLARIGRAARSARRGRVARGDGADGRIAALTTELRARALDGSPRAIEVSHDAIVAKVDGGVVEIEGEPVSVPAAAPLRVWLDETRFERAAEQPDDESFETLFAQSEKPKGCSRPVELGLGVGDDVWLAEGALLSAVEPQAVVRRARSLFLLYASLHLVTAALATGIALWGPMDEIVPKLGAALCLAHFLGSPPVLRAVRARTRMPDAARRFFRWTDAPRGSAIGAPAIG